MDGIKGLRAALRLTQEELAGAIGVSRATIANWEQNRAAPSKLARREIIRLFAEFKGEGAEKC